MNFKQRIISFLQVLFAGHTYERESAVSLDDLELVEGVCPPPLTCSFDDESENCQWKNYFPDEFMLPWSIGSGSSNISSAPLYVLLSICEEHLIILSIRNCVKRLYVVLFFLWTLSVL